MTDNVENDEHIERFHTHIMTYYARDDPAAYHLTFSFFLFSLFHLLYRVDIYLWGPTGVMSLIHGMPSFFISTASWKR